MSHHGSSFLPGGALLHLPADKGPFVPGFPATQNERGPDTTAQSNPSPTQGKESVQTSTQASAVPDVLHGAVKETDTPRKPKQSQRTPTPKKTRTPKKSQASPANKGKGSGAGSSKDPAKAKALAGTDAQGDTAADETEKDSMYADGSYWRTVHMTA
ncbi:unnamed protein product [Symbiodinium necroappetens]|uniref:Uncharacterized protein n=1 Tax=Symbiodinium necroappetens TaxID=1628268 RepID=A0A812WX05_9DINO|nr:unnamed protein product [Symbiodinium necroappetens]